MFTTLASFPALQMGIGWSAWLQIILMVAWALLLAFVVFAMVRIVLIPILEEVSSSEETDTDAALELLRERFARGEIDEEEFERRKSVLARGRK